MNKALLSAIAALAVVQASVAFACSSDGKEGIAPENDLYIPVNKFAVYTITESEFDEMTKKAQEAYDPVFESQGREFRVVSDWKNGTVNAYANRSGKVSEIHMFGGLARHPKMTKDGFMLVICHETGHHLGGAPRKGTSWASNEGQSDYYATFSCARKMWANDDNASIVARMDVPPIVKERCEKSFNTSNEVAICIRGAMGGKDLGDVLGDLGRTGDTDLSKPDPRVVSSTDNSHPAAQCRTDTYFAGAVCPKAPKDILSANDPTAEACSTERQDEMGVRPLCWYKPEGRTSGEQPPEEDPGSSWPSARVKKRARL